MCFVDSYRPYKGTYLPLHADDYASLRAVIERYETLPDASASASDAGAGAREVDKTGDDHQ